MCLCVCVRARVRARVCGCWCTGADVCLRECSLTNPTWNAPPYCHLQPLWLHHIFRHFLETARFSEQKLLNIKCVLWFFLQLLFETFLILKRIHREIFINVKRLHVKYPSFLSDFNVRSWMCRRAHAHMCMVHVALLIQHATRIHHTVLWPLGLHHIFRHYFTNGAIFGKKKLLDIKCVFWFV